MDDQQNRQNSASSSGQDNEAVPVNQPGTLIIAHDNDQQPNQPVGAEQHSQPQNQQVADASEQNIANEAKPVAPAMNEQTPESHTTSEPEPQALATNEQNWQYQSGQLDQNNLINQQNVPPAPLASVGQQDNQPQQSNLLIQWQASEFASNEKTGGWYFKLALIAVLLAGIIYAITRDVISSVVICLLGLTVGAYGALKPKIINYALYEEGIQVGEKQFDYQEFKSFAVLDDGSVPNVMLLPHKRFMIPVSMYFDPKEGDKIVETLGEFLPYEHKEPDFIDRLSTHIRF
jgi:hypothetical protein